MRYGWGVIILSVLFLQACAGGLPPPLSFLAPTPDAWLIEVQVTVVNPSPSTTPSPTFTPERTLTLTPTVTPLSAMTVTPIPTPTMDPTVAAATLQPSPAAAAAVTSSPQPPAPPAAPASGGITLLQLPHEASLPADVGRVEFKWVWDGKGCEDPPQGQGFEIRIWPDRPGAMPQGIMDASQPDAIFCEGGSGTRMYAVGNLRQTPAVRETQAGRFGWHVALVELESQRLIAVSESRVFNLAPPITTPAPSPTPTPPRTTWPAGQPAGEIFLEEPKDGVALPEKTKQFEFQWRWSRSNACELPPEGYGFELRLWPDYPGYGPLGAMGDARESQNQISCEEAIGKFRYMVMDLNKTPAFKLAGAGRFRWDVVLVRLDPYEIVVQPGSWGLEIPGKSKLE